MISSFVVGVGFVVLVLASVVFAWLWGERLASRSRSAHEQQLSQLEAEKGEMAQHIAAFQERTRTFEERAAASCAERQSLYERLETEKSRQAELLAELEGERQKLIGQERILNETLGRHLKLEGQFEHEQERCRTLSAQLASVEAKLAAQTQLVEQTKNIEKTFSALAAEVLQKSGAQLSEQQFKQIEITLAPFKQSLGEFKKQVQDSERARQDAQGQLKQQLKTVLESSAQLSQGAENLTRALKGDNKVAGDWGEVVLERVLEETGLQKGREYFCQESIRNEEGQVLRPDVVIQLPEEKCLVIDSKVSLKHWEGFVTEESDWALVESSVRQHIKLLATKNYDDLHGAQGVDYVLMFLPIEPLFLELARRSPTLLKEAWEKRVMIVAPSTLQWALRSVTAIWKFENQNKNAQEIARQAGGLHDKFVGFVEEMLKIERYLGKTQEAYDGAFNKLKTGRGNLIVSASKIAQLGARTKKLLPEVIMDEAALELPAAE